MNKYKNYNHKPSFIGKLVRIHRITKGYSQENLAKAIGKTQNWVSKFENGHLHVEPDKIIEIFKFLSIKSNNEVVISEKLTNKIMNDHSLILLKIYLDEMIKTIEIIEVIKNKIKTIM